MASRWVKAAFLAILGVIILIYADGFVDELRTNLQEHFEIAFDEIWDLLAILLWILVAWLLVDAVLTIALSFSEHKYSLVDVMKRLQRIEKKLGVSEPSIVAEREMVESEIVVKAVEESPEDDVPPPPRE